MRKWLNLFENVRTKDATRTEFDIPVADDTGLGALVPHKSATPPAQIPGVTASRAKSRTATRKALDADSAAMLGSLRASGLTDTVPVNLDHDHVGTTTGHTDPEPPVIENLPMVISSALMGHGDSKTELSFNPEWHQVKNLPGYMANAIRAMGRMVFAPFTSTPIEDIQVLSTLSNPDHDVKMMMAWIKNHGVKDDAATLRFEELLPGYNADVSVWSAEGYQFVLVQDQMGYYCYGMNGGRGTKLAAPNAMPRLEGLDDDTRNNLRELSDMADPLASEYRKFMEGTPVNSDVPSFLRGKLADADGNEVDQAGNVQNGQAQPTPATQQGSGQSNSTVKPGAQQQPDTAAPEAPQKPAGPAPVLNTAQEQARERADAQRAAANKGKI